MADTRHMSEDGLVEDQDFMDADYAEEDYAEAIEATAAEAAGTEGTRPVLVEGAQFVSFFSRVKWGRVALACIFAFLVLAASLFVWNRWYRFDDVADIQGTWRDVTSGATMEVNESYIKLADDAVYEYVLDTNAKSIRYTFGNSEGFSSYRFSEDRTQLVLEDGAGTDWGLVFHFHDDPGFAEGELADGLTRLEKVSNEVPAISAPGSNRPAGALVQSKPQGSSASSSSSGKTGEAGQAGNAGSAGAASSSSSRGENASLAASVSQTEADENGLIVGPDRNAKGYYDENGIFVPVSYGHISESGNWVEDSGGYYGSDGSWVEGPSGYYGADGSWVDYSMQSDVSGDASGQANAAGADTSGQSGYYDQYGNWIDMSAWSETGELIDAEQAAFEDAGDGSW